MKHPTADVKNQTTAPKFQLMVQIRYTAIDGHLEYHGHCSQQLQELKLSCILQWYLRCFQGAQGLQKALCKQKISTSEFVLLSE